MKKSILVTGGAGFIGSNFLKSFTPKYSNYHIYNLDKLTYAGDLENIKELSNRENYTFIKGDIADLDLINSLFKNFGISSVIHFAAESHVDNSITGPAEFIKTNITGTFNLLEAARLHWMNSPFNYKSEYLNSRFHHISTDEVYGTLGETGFFTEKTPYAPNSPYSASKASSDLIVRSYFHTYGMNVLTTNCSNNYGPLQHNEKLIPTIIRKAISNEPIPIYGDGKNIRDWLYVIDHCEAIDLAFHKGTAGETYNIGGNEEKTNLEIVDTVCSLLDELKPKKTGKYSELISFVEDRPGHDRRYAIDANKIKKELGWSPRYNFQEGIRETVISYLTNF